MDYWCNVGYYWWPSDRLLKAENCYVQLNTKLFRARTCLTIAAYSGDCIYRTFCRKLDCYDSVDKGCTLSETLRFNRTGAILFHSISKYDSDPIFLHIWFSHSTWNFCGNRSES